MHGNSFDSFGLELKVSSREIDLSAAKKLEGEIELGRELELVELLERAKERRPRKERAKEREKAKANSERVEGKPRVLE